MSLLCKIIFEFEKRHLKVQLRKWSPFGNANIMPLLQLSPNFSKIFDTYLAFPTHNTQLSTNLECWRNRKLWVDIFNQLWLKSWMGLISRKHGRPVTKEFYFLINILIESLKTRLLSYILTVIHWLPWCKLQKLCKKSESYYRIFENIWWRPSNIYSNENSTLSDETPNSFCFHLY